MASLNLLERIGLHEAVGERSIIRPEHRTQGLTPAKPLTPHGRFLVYPTPESTLPYLDVNSDTYLTPLDVLLVINELNKPATAEGEAPISVVWQAASDADSGPLDAPPSASLSPHEVSVEGLAAALAEFPATIERQSPPLDIFRFVAEDDEDLEQTLDDIAYDISHALEQL